MKETVREKLNLFMKLKTISRVSYFISIFIILAIFSLFLSYFTVNSDFPIYYYAASVIVDPNSQNESVYVLDTFNKYSLPEHMEPPIFIYSMAAAYILAPLAFMPYYAAKATMIFISIAAYMGAIIIILRNNRTTGRWFVYPIVLSCLWFPFLHNLRAAQVNTLLFLGVAIAACLANGKRPVFCGSFLGIASLFKVFPIGIAMVLGLKDWRIVASCVLVFSAALLIPGSLEWFSHLGTVYQSFDQFYIKLTHFGIGWFCLYVIVIAGTTALITLRCKRKNYAIIISFAIPAVLLTMPIIEYYHLTILMFTYIYLITSENKKNRILMTANIVSAVLISISFFFSAGSDRFHVIPTLSQILLYIGLFLSWISIAWELYKNPGVSNKINDHYFSNIRRVV